MSTKLAFKNKCYYFYNYLINLINVDKNKPEDWCVNSVNSLYLMINRVFCLLGEKD